MDCYRWIFIEKKPSLHFFWQKKKGSTPSRLVRSVCSLAATQLRVAVKKLSFCTIFKLHYLVSTWWHLISWSVCALRNLMLQTLHWNVQLTRAIEEMFLDYLSPLEYQSTIYQYGTHSPFAHTHTHTFYVYLCSASTFFFTTTTFYVCAALFDYYSSLVC